MESRSSWRWSRPRSKDPSREVDWMEEATSSCTSSTVATTIPCWEAGDAHRDVVGRQGKAVKEERWSFLSSRVRRDQAQKNRDCVGVLSMSKTTLEWWHAAALPRVERTAQQVILRRCPLMASGGGSRVNCCSMIQCQLVKHRGLSIRGFWKKSRLNGCDVHLFKVDAASLQACC